MKTLAIGLMSGTSLDGVDGALVEIKGSGTDMKVVLVQAVSIPYDPEVRQLLLDVCDIRTATVEQICQLNAYVAIHFADVVEKLLDESGARTADVSFISSHGQTIYHIPKRTGEKRWEVPSTLQIGDISYLSELTSLPVVGDFRPADMAAGGHGAPLVSYVDYVLLTDAVKHRVVQNIGGIGNVTFLRANGRTDQVISFDTGPGNMVIDAMMRKITKGEKTYDQNGSFAQTGSVHEELLEKLMSHPHVVAPYPKTTGREDFGEQFLEDIWSQALKMNVSDEDVVATVTDWTAQSIAKSYEAIEQREQIKIDEAIISGGGVQNQYLFSRIQAHIPHIEVKNSSKVGIDPDQKEAIAFAMLGHATINGQYNTLPSATTATHPVIMGKVAYTQPESFQKIVRMIESDRNEE